MACAIKDFLQRARRVTFPAISRTLALHAAMGCAVVLGGCSPFGSKAGTTRTMDKVDPLGEVENAALEDWRLVGGRDWSRVNDFGAVLVQDARSTQAEVKALVARHDADRPLAVLERRVDARLKDRRLSKPTAGQRQQALEEVLKAMDDDRRMELRASIDTLWKLLSKAEASVESLGMAVVQINHELTRASTASASPAASFAWDAASS